MSTVPSGDDGALPLRNEPRLGRKLFLSLVVGGLFVWLLHAGALPVLPDPTVLAKVSLGYVALAGLAWAVTLLIRAARWQLLLAPVRAVPTLSVVAVALAGFAATLILPLRSGEVVRPLLIRREGVNAWAATGTVGAERVLDGLTVSLLLLASLFLSPPRTHGAGDVSAFGIDTAVIAGAAHAAAAVFAAASIALVLFYRFQALPERLLMATLGRFKPGAAEGIASRVRLVASGIGFLSRPQVALPFFVATVAAWGINATGIWLLARGVGLSELTATQSCAALGVLAIGVIPPSAPGLFGTFQFALYAGLALYFPKARLESDGSVLVFLMYVTQVALTLGFGALGLAHVLRSRSRKLAENLPESDNSG